MQQPSEQEPPAKQRGDGKPALLRAPFDKATGVAAQQVWAAHLKQDVETTNSLGMKLVLIPPGEFQMGSPGELQMGSPETAQEASSAELPQHAVRITQPYYLGKYEVTQVEYEAVMGVNPSYLRAKGRDSSQVTRQDTSRFPVEQVSWLDAVAFCNKLSEKEKLLAYYRIEGGKVEVSGGGGYRLPTEAEWEYACRAGTPTVYGFGDDGAKLGDHAWFDGNAQERTHPVGEKLSNGLGLHDMHGNVWEWCWDWHGNYGAGAVVDPRGASTGSFRVFRGGGWNDSAWGCRTTYRYGGSSGVRDDYLGFRVLRAPSASQ